MKITGFKVLKGGMGGIKVDGIDLVESGTDRAMFKDTVSRTRTFPLSLQLRNAIAVLNYPFLVGTEHWRQEFAEYMRDDFSSPDRKKGNPMEKTFKTLISFWDSAKIVQCTVEKGNYKITGEVACEMCTIKAIVNVIPSNEYSLYSFVESAIVEIVRLVEQTITTPQLALNTAEQIREVYDKVASDDDEKFFDNMDAGDAYLMLMRTAKKKGFGIVLDDNLLAELAASTEASDGEDQEGEDDVDPFKEMVVEDDESTDEELSDQEKELEKLTQVVNSKNIFLNPTPEFISEVLGETTATIKSKKTKDKGIFVDSVSDDFTPDPEPEFAPDPENDLI